MVALGVQLLTGRSLQWTDLPLFALLWPGK